MKEPDRVWLSETVVEEARVERQSEREVREERSAKDPLTKQEHARKGRSTCITT